MNIKFDKTDIGLLIGGFIIFSLFGRPDFGLCAVGGYTIGKILASIT